jgi:hypothetical protein
MSDFAPALDVANAVLYEGYLLYPYTASATKNRYRWQFGVVVPLEYASGGTGETAMQQTEVLLESDGDPLIDARLRFLQVEARRVEAAQGDGFVPVESLDVDGTMHLSFDEAVEREADLQFRPKHEARAVIPIAFQGSQRTEFLRDAQGTMRGRVVREHWPLHGMLAVTAERLAGERDLSKVRIHLENHSHVVAAGARAAVLRTAFVSTHVLLGIEGGRFLSALDPPEYAREATAGLENRHVWPVLIGESAADTHGASLVLSSPIILYDFPAVAARSERDAFDGTEIEELLRLSVLGLSDAERSEARATDPRARAIVDWAERLGPQHIDALHAGALERFDPGPMFASDPLASLDVPALDCVFIGGTKVSKGSTVRLHPKRRADVWDTFLAGKVATVCAIHQDVEDQFYVAVTVDDDPASDLHEWYGRSFFFYPEEIEPVVEQGIT